jgi:hypothetical protein
MRFDEASAIYALFGELFIEVRLPIEKLGGWLRDCLQAVQMHGLPKNSANLLTCASPRSGG